VKFFNDTMASCPTAICVHFFLILLTDSFTTSNHLTHSLDAGLCITNRLPIGGQLKKPVTCTSRDF